MCGIAGAIDLKSMRAFPPQVLSAMLEATAHRGPDDKHLHIEPGLGLGSNRLAIVDLQNGRQPLSNEEGDIWVSFNGELFDHASIRDSLVLRGHRFKTQCDTELWVHLYEELGEEVFTKATGQFAVALWQRAERKLYLARDRVGICPLFYAEHDGWLLWASEIKALLASRLVTPRPDVRGLHHFFTSVSAGPTRTCFEGVSSIAPGHYLRVHDGRIEIRQYWDLEFPDAGDELRFENPGTAVEELEEILRSAVRRRLGGDVPVVSYLSGGLDSTTILGLSSQELGRPLPAYTIGLDQAGPDERMQAAESAEALGCPLTTVSMNRAEIASLYPKLIRAAESPVIDTSCACMLRLSDIVHGSGYRVVMTGEGADEALAGYRWFRTEQIGNHIGRWTAQILPWFLHRLVLKRIGGGRAHRPPWASMGGVRTVQQELGEWYGQTREQLFAAGMWEQLGDHSPFTELGITNSRIERWHPLNRSLYVGYKTLLPGMLLSSKGDRVALNSSVETRYPFLDEDVITYCAGVDPQYKLNGKKEKWLLRKVAEKALPSKIANRPKTMFRATLSQTFLGKDGPAWVEQLLSRESLLRTGYFDPEGVTSARAFLVRGAPLARSKMQAFDLGLTAVIATQLWHHIFCGGNLADLPAWTPPQFCSITPID